MRALRAAREIRPAAKPIEATSRDERAFVDDLPFDTDEDMKDLAAVALLNGVRFNDLRGHGPNEVDSLAEVHGDANHQADHCLRSSAEDEPSGTESALRACRAFITERVRDALAGLDANGIPDAANRVPLAVDLSLRGGVEAPLPRYYVRMGEALHAVQDGFTHTYRNEDRTQVTVVLNYVDVVEKTHDTQRDGPPHSRELDRCDVDDAMRVRNVTLAVQASFDLLVVTLAEGKTVEEKMMEVDAVLDRYFTYRPGCTAANGWCDAPEAQLDEKSGCGCATPGMTSGGLGLAGLVALASVAAVARRRRRVIAGIGAGLLALACPSIARADDEPAPEAPAEARPAEAPPAEVHEAAHEAAREAVKEEEHQTLIGLYAAGAASISNPAGAAMAGLRLRLGDHWALGADGEWNGWYGVHSGRLRTGSVNIYGSIIARFPLRFEVVNLRSTLQLGTAIQVVDLYGAPSGSTGLFVGFNPLGVEWKLSKAIYAIFYPLGIALPVTQLTGAPFAYPQYRSTLGLELSF